MGLQSFKFATDFLNNLEKPIIYIAKKDKTIVNSVSVYDGLKLTFNLNAFQTAEFKIYRDIDGKRQDYFNDFEEEMLILIPGIGWYEIHVETNIAQTGIFKSITATSLECKLCDKRLIDFECNAGEILYDDYVRTIFYDPTNPKGSLLHRILNVAPNWYVGYVDASLASMQRTFDVDDTDVYSFLTGEVSEAFNCLFVFDTFNETVNAYDLDKYGTDTNIFVSMDNLAQNMTETIDQNSIITCYRVNGGDGVYINEVNPNGTNKLYNFEYYLPQMSSDIQTKVISYNNKYQSLKPQYEDIMLRMQTQVDIIQELNTRLPDSLSSKDWTKYGLSFLESKQKSFKTQDELYCTQGMNKPESLSYNLYKQNLQDLNDVTAELSVRQGEIDSATALYNSIKAERDALQQQLDMDNWFTEDEWKSLDNYVVEATYDNDNYIVTDLEDDSERFEIERQLYEVAWKDLSKKCRPQYQYSATLANILTIPEFKNFLEYFELGNFIRMETDYDTIVKLRMISFTVDYTNTQTIDVTFSDAVRVHDVYDDAASIQAQANSAAMSFKFNKDQYDNSVRQGNFIAEMRKYGLDVATTQIYNATDQSQTWDSTGMTFRKWNNERQDYDPEMIKIINNMMVFLDGDNGARMAIGKISLPNGNSCYGINCELLANKLTMSENLWIENNSGTYKFTDDGFNASNGTNTLKIQPNNDGELFSIYKKNDKKFYIDSSGNLHFEGDLTGATGTFSGALKGGSINLGNGTFTVDSDGNMIANSGTFGGSLQSATGTFSGKVQAGEIVSSKISGSTITGSDINANLFRLKVDPSSFENTSNFTHIDGSYYMDAMKFGFETFTIYYPPFLGIENKQVTVRYIQIGDAKISVNASNGSGCISVDTINAKNYMGSNGALNIKDLDFDMTSSGNFETGRTYNGDTYNIASVKWVMDHFTQEGHTHDEYASSTHEHTVKPYKGTTTSSSGSHNFMYGLSMNGGTTGSKNKAFTYTYSYVNGSLSDERLKENIKPIEDISDKYMRLVPIQFNFHDDINCVYKGTHYGFGAMAVSEIFNDDNLAIICKEHQEDEAVNKYLDGDDAYVLDKDELHALHVQMIQKHEHEIKLLKQEIKKLKETIKK